MDVPAITYANTFQYQLLPSAFQIAECPTYLCWKAMKQADKLWNRDAATQWERLKNRTFAVLSGAGGYLGGMYALPITLCCAPVTLLADVVIGVFEYAYCYKKGLPKADLDIIKQRKLLVCPGQQLAFCLGAIAVLGLIALRVAPFNSFTIAGLKASLISGFKYALVLWPGAYAVGQCVVGEMPARFNHHSFNIFIGGGGGDGTDEEEKWLDSHIFTKPQTGPDPTFNQKRPPAQKDWKAFLTSILPDLNRVNDAGLHVEYIRFKQRILNKEPPENLFSLPTPLEQQELTRKYRKLSLILHPDKNHPRQKEATALFAVLQEAYERLEKH